MPHGVHRAIVTPSSFSPRTILNSAGTPEHAGDYHIHADITQDEPAPQSVGERRYTVQRKPEAASTVHAKTMGMSLSAHMEGVRVNPIVIHTWNLSIKLAILVEPE